MELAAAPLYETNKYSTSSCWLTAFSRSGESLCTRYFVSSDSSTSYMLEMCPTKKTNHVGQSNRKGEQPSITVAAILHTFASTWYMLCNGSVFWAANGSFFGLFTELLKDRKRCIKCVATFTFFVALHSRGVMQFLPILEAQGS